MSRKERRRREDVSHKSHAGGTAATASAAIANRIACLQREAMQFSQANQPHRALAICRELLTLQPTRSDLLSFAGVLAFKSGHMEKAAALHRRAIAAKPDVAEFHFNLDSTLGQLGRLEDAAAAYRKALELRPDFTSAHHNLGNTLRALGRLPEAVESYRRELACRPTAEGERDLGIALHDLQQLVRRSPLTAGA
jgi:tetratricopeptide (TPR) repeat protein